MPDLWKPWWSISEKGRREVEEGGREEEEPGLLGLEAGLLGEKSRLLGLGFARVSPPAREVAELHK